MRSEFSYIVDQIRKFGSVAVDDTCFNVPSGFFALSSAGYLLRD